MAGMGGIIFASQVNSVALTFPPGNLLLNAIASAVIGGVSTMIGGSCIAAGEAGGAVALRLSRWRGVRTWNEPLLLVLDEFHELVAVVNELPSIMRADWDRLSGHTQLRILLCGSAVRAMESMQEQREPLYGRFSLSLLVHPSRPHEAALMLPNLSPADRALVWGILGGMPLYLSWWDQAKSVTDNLRTLACSPGAPLLREGELIMATEAGASNLAHQVLYAVASKKTRFGEIRDAVKTDPTRVLERLVSLRLVERLVPVTDTDSAASRGIYRIADNFLIFWLDVVNNQRSAIDTGMVDSVLPVIEASIDDHMGLRWGGGLSQPHSQAGPGWPVG